MRNRIVLVFGAVGFAIVALWWFFVYSPAGDELDDARADREAAESQTPTLQAQLQQLQEIDSRGPEIDAQLMQLEGLVPAAPDLAGFILSANEIAVRSGIDWLSISPSEPAASPAGGPAVINMNISIQGGFFQALEYLNQFENLSRLVIIDSVNISGVAGEQSDDGSVTTATSSLSISLAARMFTNAQPELPVVPGTPAPTDDTTTTVPQGDAADDTSEPDAVSTSDPNLLDELAVESASAVAKPVTIGEAP